MTAPANPADSSHHLTTPPPHHPTTTPPHHLIFLIGPRASGKTTVARLLAELLDWAWVDADAVLEQRAGRTIREIFAAEGEPAFRDLESVVLAEVCGQTRAVVATGGGVVLRPENRARLRAAGRCVWLTADPATLWRRLQADATTADRRPDLSVGGLNEVEELLRQREPLYRDCAGLAVDTARHAPHEIACMIRDWWQSR